MKKFIFILLGTIVVSVVAYRLLIRNQTKEIGVLSDKEPTFMDAIVVDSVKIQDKYVYWFCYDLGVKGYSNGKLAYANNITLIKDNVFFHSSYITGIEYDFNSRLLIVHTFDNPNRAADKKQEVTVKPNTFEVEIIKDGNAYNSLDARLMKINKDKKRIDLQEYQ